MKVKKIKKQLILNKHTIARLGDENMTEVKGGLPWTVPCTMYCVTHTAYNNCVCESDEIYCPYQY